MRVRILTAADINRCFSMPQAINAMKSAFTQLSEGTAIVPDRVSVYVDAGVSLYMPGYLPEGGHLAAKIVTVFPENRKSGFPVIQGVVLVLDSETGEVKALMDGSYITALRTGAASGLATDILALPDSSVLTVFGAGAQARTQVEAVRAVRTIEEIRIVDKSSENAELFAGEIDGAHVTVMEDARQAVSGAQVIITATDSLEPVFPGSVLGSGTHVNAIGAFTPEMRELDGDLVSKAKVVVDYRETVMVEAGDLTQAIDEGVFSLDQIHAELGELVNESRPGRENSEEITVFKSVGNAVQDVAVAGAILEQAESLESGSLVDL